MADRKATNRYYPPEFWDDPKFSDKSNLNSFRGEGWRNRGAQVNSKLLTQGRNVIRFETPFDIWCEGCNEVIHKGVRFNADKEKAGKYFSTTIWHFDLKCHLCDNKMVVATDPENCTYKCVSGCRRKEESWAEDADTLTKPDVREKRKLEDDPFYRLEHFAAGDGSGKTADEVRGKEAKATLYQLKAMQDVRSSEDGSLNRALRKSFQKKKKDDIAEEKDAAAERDRFNMHIPLLPASEDDAAAARSQAFGARAVLSEDARYEALRRKTMRAVMNAPILQQQRAPSTPGSGISSPASSSGASRTSSSASSLDKIRALALARQRGGAAGAGGIDKKRRLSAAAAARSAGGGGAGTSSLKVGSTVIRRRSAGDAPLGLGGGF
eukprot:Tamp_06095.p1 GENE.Tamp_06095~~Tamp_06095.p1  ORF type:complete len:380 (+),score=128.99 Tamp_06095:394-1533(+)